MDIAITRSESENLTFYCESIIANYAMMNIDVVNYPVSREIYFMDDESDK